MRRISNYIIALLTVCYIPFLLLLPLVLKVDGGFIDVTYSFVLLLLAMLSFPVWVAVIAIINAVDAMRRADKTKKGIIFIAAELILAFGVLIALASFADLPYPAIALAVGLGVILIFDMRMRGKLREILDVMKKKSFWLCAILLIVVIGAACSCSSELSASKNQLDEYAEKGYFEAKVIEVTENNLLVEPLEGYSERRSSDLFSVPNFFNEEKPLNVGDEITIHHDGTIMETYPARLGKIYRMSRTLDDDLTEEVVID